MVWLDFRVLKVINSREMAKYMVSLGCKTGFNLDGGGSVSLIVKQENSEPQVIVGNTRYIADIIYFHEQ